MSFPNPDDIQLIGPVSDSLGTEQIALARPIGGGADADGQDEATINLENSVWSWVSPNRCALSTASATMSASEIGPHESESVAYEVVGTIPVQMPPGADAIWVDLDWEHGRVRLQALTPGDTTVGSPVESGEIALRQSAAVKLTGLSSSVTKVRVELKENERKCRLFRAQVRRQAPLVSVDSASYTEVAQILVQLGPGRDSLAVDLDWEDGQLRAGVYDAADDTLLGVSQETPNSTTRTQTELQFSGVATPLIYVKLEMKRASAQCRLFGALVGELKGNLDNNDEYGFKKVHGAALDGLQPYDGVMHRLVLNTEAGYKARVHRAGAWWPMDVAPVLAAHKVVGYRLGWWRVPPGVGEVNVILRHRVDDASVKLGLAVYDLLRGARRLTTLRTTDTIEPTGGVVTTTLTALNVSPYQRRDVLLVLLEESEDTETSYVQSVDAGTNHVGLNRVSNLSDITFTAGKRWRLDFGPSLAGGGLPPGGDFPEERTIIRQDGDTAYTWPLFDAEEITNVAEWAQVDHTVRVTEIGQTTIYSVVVAEGDVQERPDLRGGLRPGMPPSAGVLRELHRRHRELHLRRTRMHHALGGYDPGDLSNGAPRTVWGTIRRWEDAWRDLGACVIKGTDGAIDKRGERLVRSRLRIAGVLVVGRAHGSRRDFEVDLRARLSSFDGDARQWGEDGEVGEALTYSGRVLGQSMSRTGEALTVGAGDPNYFFGGHHLQGAADAEDVGQVLRDGLYPFELVVDDTTAPAERRLLQIQVRGREVNQYVADRVQITLAAWSCWTDEYPGN